MAIEYPAAPAKLQFGEALRHMLDSLVTDVIHYTEQQVRGSGVQTAEEVRRAPARLAGLSETGRAQNATLKTFLFRHVYNLPVITEDSERSVRCLEELFVYYLQKTHSMPETHEDMARGTPRHVVVCDYIAGMTDQFLLRQHQEQFGSPAPAVPSIARPQRIEWSSVSELDPCQFAECRSCFFCALWCACASGRPQIPGLTSPPATAASQQPSLPPDPLGRETPRGCLLGFIKAAQEEKYSLAVQYFQPRPARRHVSEEDEEELAEQLLAILNQKFSGPLDS